MEDQTDTTQFSVNPRNKVIEEICEALDDLAFAFGKDTIDSFKVFIRGFQD
jgi:hypothetical protein